MRSKFIIIPSLATILAFALPGLSQSSADQGSTAAPKTVHKQKKTTGPGKEMGKGGEDIGKGVAKGSGDLAKGTAKGVGKLATGHPVKAGASMGKGVGGLGKNVGVGTGKGVGKIGKGVGGELKKLKKKPAEKQEKAQ